MRLDGTNSSGSAAPIVIPKKKVVPVVAKPAPAPPVKPKVPAAPAPFIGPVAVKKPVVPAVFKPVLSVAPKPSLLALPTKAPPSPIAPITSDHEGQVGLALAKPTGPVAPKPAPTPVENAIAKVGGAAATYKPKAAPVTVSTPRTQAVDRAVDAQTKTVAGANQDLATKQADLDAMNYDKAKKEKALASGDLKPGVADNVAAYDAKLVKALPAATASRDQAGVKAVEERRTLDVMSTQRDSVKLEEQRKVDATTVQTTGAAAATAYTALTKAAPGKAPAQGKELSAAERDALSPTARKAYDDYAVSQATAAQAVSTSDNHDLHAAGAALQGLAYAGDPAYAKATKSAAARFDRFLAPLDEKIVMPTKLGAEKQAKLPDMIAKVRDATTTSDAAWDYGDSYVKSLAPDVVAAKDALATRGADDPLPAGASKAIDLGRELNVKGAYLGTRTSAGQVDDARQRSDDATAALKAFDAKPGSATDPQRIALVNAAKAAQDGLGIAQQASQAASIGFEGALANQTAAQHPDDVTAALAAQTINARADELGARTSADAVRLGIDNVKADLATTAATGPADPRLATLAALEAQQPDAQKAAATAADALNGTNLRVGFAQSLSPDEIDPKTDDAKADFLQKQYQFYQDNPAALAGLSDDEKAARQVDPSKGEGNALGSTLEVLGGVALLVGSVAISGTGLGAAVGVVGGIEAINMIAHGTKDLVNHETSDGFIAGALKNAGVSETDARGWDTGLQLAAGLAVGGVGIKAGIKGLSTLSELGTTGRGLGLTAGGLLMADQAQAGIRNLAGDKDALAVSTLGVMGASDLLGHSLTAEEAGAVTFAASVLVPAAAGARSRVVAARTPRAGVEVPEPTVASAPKVEAPKVEAPKVEVPKTSTTRDLDADLDPAVLDLRARPAAPSRLVVGGVDAVAKARPGEVFLNNDRSAGAHITGDIEAAPFKSGSFQDVFFENVQKDLFTGASPASLTQAARLLEPGGRVDIQTGGKALAYRDDIVASLEGAGFKDVQAGPLHAALPDGPQRFTGIRAEPEPARLIVADDTSARAPAPGDVLHDVVRGTGDAAPSFRNAYTGEAFGEVRFENLPNRMFSGRTPASIDEAARLLPAGGKLSIVTDEKFRIGAVKTNLERAGFEEVAVRPADASRKSGPLEITATRTNDARPTTFPDTRPGNLTVHPGKQGKHQTEHPNYVPTKSELTADAQSLVDEYHGVQGQSGSKPAGAPNTKTRVDFGRVIGNHVNQFTGERSPTRVADLHYAADDVHVVPVREFDPTEHTVFTSHPGNRAAVHADIDILGAAFGHSPELTKAIHAVAEYQGNQQRTPLDGRITNMAKGPGAGAGGPSSQGGGGTGRRAVDRVKDFTDAVFQKNTGLSAADFARNARHVASALPRSLATTLKGLPDALARAGTGLSAQDLLAVTKASARTLPKTIATNAKTFATTVKGLPDAAVRAYTGLPARDLATMAKIGVRNLPGQVVANARTGATNVKDFSNAVSLQATGMPLRDLLVNLKAANTNTFENVGGSLRANWTQTGHDFLNANQPGRVDLLKGLKYVGGATLGVNALGLVGGAAYYFATAETRTSQAVTSANALSELAKLQADPGGYLHANYAATFLGFGSGFTLDGHLRATQETADLANHGTGTYYYRRVPNDLFTALKQAQVDRGNDDPRVTVQEQVLDAQGKLKTVSVEILAPYRNDPFRNALPIVDAQGNADGSPGGRVRINWAIGPIEGLRPHVDGDFSFMSRYNTTDDPVTSLRVQLPTATNPPGADVRQQMSTNFARAGLSFNVLDFNSSKSIDLNDPGSITSGHEYTIGNARLYLDTGNRNREQIGATTKGDFARARETGYAELGAGTDFFKVTSNKNDYTSLNAYDELGAYMPDLRVGYVGAQGAQGAFTRGPERVLKPVPPTATNDASIQLSTTAIGGVVPGMPFALPPASEADQRLPGQGERSVIVKPAPVVVPSQPAPAAPAPAAPAPKYVTVDGRVAARRTLTGIARTVANEKHIRFQDALDEIYALNTQYQRPRANSVITTKPPGDPDLLYDGNRIRVG